MKTIGKVIEETRISKHLSFKKLEETTKIKAAFIESIEKEDWSKLPPFPTVLGFVKSISGELGIDEKMAVSILKRDYPPKNLNINPQKTRKNFVWSPKLTFSIGISLIVLVILGYLGIQYVRFISPPSLAVESPVEGQIISGNSVLVFGETDSDAKITVDNQPVLIDNDGKFSVTINITKDTGKIEIVAVGRSGKVRTVERTIKISE